MKDKSIILWIAALIIGGILGCFGIGAIDSTFNVIATIFSRLFQFIALPTIAVTILTTLASMAGHKGSGKIFSMTLCYTLLTTFASAFVALGVYSVIKPDSLSTEVLSSLSGEVASAGTSGSYGEHLLQVIPNNIIQPFLSANVLSVLLIAAAFGIAICFMPKSESRDAVLNFFKGLQEILFILIKWLIKVLPLGIMAFAGQLTAQFSSGMVLGSLGKYTAVVLTSNVLQMFIVLPLFLLANRINPIKTFKAMSPALLVALFTKSSAGTLPLTIESAEKNNGIKPGVSRFVLPICTTINMNGCAAFILITSMFLMQNAGIELSFSQVLLWVFLSVISAVGNAGVPMGCYFLTLSLMSGSGVPIGIMGIILPIYAIIDMVETAENVWSDSCVCTIVDKKII